LLKPIGNVPDHNSQVEQQEIAWLKTAPDKCFLYVKMPAPQWQVVNSSCHVAGSFATRQQAEEFKTSLKTTSYGGWQVSKLQQLSGAKIQTFLGTDVATNVVIGSQVHGGFGFNTYRRSVTCRIFGVKYVGWFHESSGDYCRLKESKTAVGQTHTRRITQCEKFATCEMI